MGHRTRKQQQKRLMNVMHRSRNFKHRSTNSATCLPYYLLTELFSNLIVIRVFDIFIFVLSGLYAQGLYAQSLYAHIMCRAYMPRAYMPRACMLTSCIGPICSEPICSRLICGLFAQVFIQ